MDVTRTPHAMAMTDFEAPYPKSVTDFDIPSTAPFPECDVSALLQALKCH